jgi:hypothetical protein
VDRAVKILEALFTCDYAGSAMCSFRPDDAPEQIASMAISWVGSAYMFVFFARVWGLGLPLTLAIPAVYVFVACRILMTVYQLKFGCLVKLVFPVCVWDDLYAAVTDTLGAPHIAWPEGLLPRQLCVNSETCVNDTLESTDVRVSRALSIGGYTVAGGNLTLKTQPRSGRELVQNPTDCSADPLRFTGGTQTTLWALEYWTPGANMGQSDTRPLCTEVSQFSLLSS